MTNNCNRYVRLHYQQSLVGKLAEGIVVEIDKSLFTRKKNNAGRVLPQQYSVVCKENNDIFVVEFLNHLALSQKTEGYPGCIIYSGFQKD